ncbi:MAG: polyprenyl diphosphate synthase, partial [Candidatus Woesearchaeota archaeon]|nr:polyprenyl diphosphate synthase [Candidatus Woesearchaeota archaeon]
RIRIRFIGRISMLPKKIRNEISAVEKKTGRFSGYFFNFAIAYGGRQEILDAAREIARKAVSGKINPERINEKVFESHLLLKSKPDIVIRTAGDLRTSNFLPWQSAYSEWFFIKKSWPEFRKSDLKRIILEFSHRKRNFGR